MGVRFNVLIIVVGLVALIGSMSVFTVNPKEHAIKFRFGEIIKSDYEPGLHYKLPVVHSIRKFNKRILTIDNRPERFITGERKYVNVDFFVKWRIHDVAAFYRATLGSYEGAGDRLLAIVTDGLKRQFAERTIRQVVSAERSQLLDEMLVTSQARAADFGVEIIDIRVKRIDLPDAVSESVFNRMRQERARIAKQLRAEGFERSEQIRSSADRQSIEIEASAYRDAEIIRGQGDARSADIYARAYTKNEEFYAFYRSMQAYRNSIGLEQDLLLLKPDSDFFKYLGNRQGD